MATPEDDDVTRFARMVGSAERIFVLTGAGMSTESGIPDFRGPDGLWTRNPAAMKMFDIATYRRDREIRIASWRTRLESPIRTARPNDGHLALASWQRAKHLGLATQNIDGLHQRGGARDVMELHGSFWQSRCLDCGARGPIGDTFARVLAGEEDPPCLACGGIVRTSTIAFGQALDPDVWRSASQAATGSDLALAIGTSLAVQPAASLCETAILSGARLVVLNAAETAYDSLASLVLRRQIGPTLATASALLGLPLR